MPSIVTHEESHNPKVAFDGTWARIVTAWVVAADVLLVGELTASGHGLDATLGDTFLD